MKATIGLREIAFGAGPEPNSSYLSEHNRDVKTAEELYERHKNVVSPVQLGFGTLLKKKQKQ